MAESLDHVFKVLMIGDAGKFVCQKVIIYFTHHPFCSVRWLRMGILYC